MAIRILTVIGARPQFVKAMMLSSVFGTDADINEVVVHTGQHYDTQMSDVFFHELGMRMPDYHDVAVHGGSAGEPTQRSARSRRDCRPARVVASSRCVAGVNT